MSLSHYVAFRIIKKGKKPFDRNNPPDYVRRRIREDKTNNKIHRGVKCESVVLNDVPGEFLFKESNPKDKIIFYIHGGGFVTGSSVMKRAFTSLLAFRSGHNVYSVNYSLAPEHRFPRGINDCFAFYEGLVKRYGAQNICVMGESAGGNLTLSLIHMAKDRGIGIPSCAVAMSPSVQLYTKYPSYDENAGTDCMLGNDIGEEINAMYFENAGENESVYASPILGDFTGFPPTYITVSDSEVLYDDSVILDRKLTESGVASELKVYHKLMHAWPVIPAFPESRKAIKDIIAFINNHS